jgi:hypothetical protein
MVPFGLKTIFITALVFLPLCRAAVISGRAVWDHEGQMPSTYGLDRPMPQRYVPELLFIGDKAFIGDKDFAAQSARGPDLQTNRDPNQPQEISIL